MVGGSRPFPINYVNIGISSSLAVRYHFGPHTAARLSLAFSRSSSEGANYLGSYRDNFDRAVDVLVELPEFTSTSVLFSLEKELPLGGSASAGELLTFKVGGGFHSLTGSATYINIILEQFIERSLLSYPPDTDPMLLVGAAYSRNLSPLFRVETGLDLSSFVSTNPGFDQSGIENTKGKFVVLLPTIYLGVWFMIGQG